MAISYSQVLLQHRGKMSGHRASQVRTPFHIPPEATVMGGSAAQCSPSAASWWSHPKHPGRWLRTAMAVSTKGLQTAVPSTGSTQELSLPAQTCSHSPPLLCSPLCRTRRHLDALGRKKKCCDLFPHTYRLDIFIGVCSRNRPWCRRGTARTDPDMQLHFSDAQHRVLQGLRMPLSILHLE